MTRVVHDAIEQGSDEWVALRCGRLTASNVRLLLSPAFKPASNDRERAHLFELLAQRITGHVEPQYWNDDMLRGLEDEVAARGLYAARFGPVREVGFVTEDRWGFTLGCSPDGLVGDQGMIECKSRKQRLQVETISRGHVPPEHMAQVQAGLLVTGRAWCDYLSYSAGLPMIILRVLPDAWIQQAIVNAAGEFEARLAERLAEYRLRLRELPNVPTERRVEQEIVA